MSLSSDSNDDESDPSSEEVKFDGPMEQTETFSPMVDCSFLSHVMLKVPNVRQTVNYWLRQQGGAMTISNPKKKKKEEEQATNGSCNEDDNELQSAFVELGHYKVGGGKGNSRDDENNDDQKTSKGPPSFSLELVTTNETNFKLGNCISYIGINMLQQFATNPIEVISRKFVPGIPPPTSSTQDQLDEPNGINIKYVASSPGDMIARIAFYSKDLQSTYNFYTQLLGMDCKAQDDTMICLRYNTNAAATATATATANGNDGENTKTSSGMGVTTTLVFEKTNESEDIDIGNCFDHLVIATTANIDDLYLNWKKPSKMDTTTDADATSDDGESASYSVNGDGNSSSSKSTSNKSSSSTPTIFMNPTNMFGKKIMGILDPNGYKVIIAGE